MKAAFSQENYEIIVDRDVVKGTVALTAIFRQWENALYYASATYSNQRLVGFFGKPVILNFIAD